MPQQMVCAIQDAAFGLRDDLDRVVHDADLEPFFAEVGTVFVGHDRPLALFKAREFGERDVQGVAGGFFKLHCIFVGHGRLKPEFASVVRGGGDRGGDSEEQSEGGVSYGIRHGKRFLSEFS